MRLTTKTRYGLRAVEELVMSGGQGPVPVSVIARNQNIPVPYLEQLLHKLKNRGIVRSVRGTRGGYVLAADPSGITVYDVVKALEGDVAIVFCVSEDIKDRERCDRTEKCVTRALWSSLNNSIKKTMESMSLKDLCGHVPEGGLQACSAHKFHYSI
ncbi:MAG: RrF2 family transcriptional regulator [Candidatus Omnitrophota bacterium]